MRKQVAVVTLCKEMGSLGLEEEMGFLVLVRSYFEKMGLQVRSL